MSRTPRGCARRSARSAMATLSRAPPPRTRWPTMCIIRGLILLAGTTGSLPRIADHRIENEDLVNIPNWLPLTMRAEGGDWLRPDNVEYLDYRQELDLRCNVLTRFLRFRDGEGRVTRWDERRIVSMHDPHMAALSVTTDARKLVRRR